MMPLENRRGSTKPPGILRWRPFYLRRSVLSLFGAALLLALVAIEILLDQYNKHCSIANGRSESTGQRYLWMFGPHSHLHPVCRHMESRRFSEQASRSVASSVAAAAQSPEPHVATGLSLGSFARGPYSRRLGTEIISFPSHLPFSVLLKALVVVSTGLMTLSWTPVLVDSYPLTARNAFKNSNSSLSSTGTVAYYMLSGHTEKKFDLSRWDFQRLFFPVT